MASIHERARKNGSTGYQLAWRDPDSGLQERETFNDRQEAELWKRLLDANGQSMARADSIYDEQQETGPTVRDQLLAHIHQLTRVGPYQLARYESAVDLHFTGDLGAKRLGRLRHQDIVQWIKYMQGKGLSAKTIANQHGLLSSALETAVRDGLVKANPCKGVRLPKSNKAEESMHLITHEEWDRLIFGLPAHYVAFFQFLIGTGLRFSEATALLASDFKLNAKTPSVRVSKAWKDDGANGFYVGPPKTPKSKRTVSMAPSTVEAVRARVEAAGDGLVFKQPRGGAIRSSQAWKIWGPACKLAGYTVTDRPRIHDVRHSHASWMVGAGMEIFALSRRLGHESITTTMDRYSHLLPDAHFTGAQVAAKALEG
jgi:integrase